MTFFRKKYYREVPCKACDGSGKIKKESHLEFTGTRMPVGSFEKVLKLNQDICLACSGRGTQTVLERME